MTKESFCLFAKNVVNAYEQVKIVWLTVVKVAQKMDGKVYNKRFTDAVNVEIDGIGCVYMEGDKMGIYLENRCYNDGSFRVYFDKDIYYIYIWNVSKLLNNGRIDAAKFRDACQRLIDDCNMKIDELRDAAKHFDRYEKKVRKALAAFNDVMGGVNPLFKPSNLHSFDWEKASCYHIYKK